MFLIYQTLFENKLPICNMDFTFANEFAILCGYYILSLVHCIYNFLCYIINYVVIVFTNSKRQFLRTFKTSHDIASLIKERVKCFPKLPKNLAIIIEEEEISYEDCIKLIVWCSYSGIPYITIYSFNSAINPHKLYERLYKNNRDCHQRIVWGNSFDESIKDMAKKELNGYAWTPSIEVNLYDSKSAYDSIENVLLSFCNHKVDPEKMTLTDVDDKFKEEIASPDPCFALVFGKAMSTYGFMPWQLRVTELLHMATHHELNVEDFISALHCYAYCDQRFGK